MTTPSVRRLTAQDVDRVTGLWDAVGRSATDPLDLGALLVQVAALVPCDYASITEIDDTHGRWWGWYTEAEPAAADRAAFARYAHQHPLLSHVRRTGHGGPWRLSDVADPRFWHTLDLYDTFFRPRGVERQVTFTLGAPHGDVVGAVALNRSGRDFDDGEVSVLAAVRPIFVGLARVARDRRRERSTAAGGARPHRPGVAVLDLTGHWEWVDPRAVEILEHFFPDRAAPDVAVPAQLLRWLAGGRTSFRTEHDGLALTVELGPLLDGRRTIFVRSTPAETSGLTPRELEVLSLVADGLTNGQVAHRLAVRPRTVEKHLENVFAKLGVDNRTSAARTLFERPGVEGTDGSKEGL